jgi:hypothetical protein
MTLGPLDDPEYSMLEAHKQHYQLREDVADVPAGEIGLLMDTRDTPNNDVQHVDKLLLLRFKGRSQLYAVTEQQAMHV